MTIKRFSSKKLQKEFKVIGACADLLSSLKNEDAQARAAGYLLHLFGKEEIEEEDKQKVKIEAIGFTLPENDEDEDEGA